MTPEETKEMAEAFRLALIVGLAPVEDVVSWADKVIQIDPDPAFEIIDIASSPCSIADMVSKLSAVPGEGSALRSIENLFGIAGNTLSRDPSMGSHIAGQLKAKVSECGQDLPADVKAKIASIDAAFDAASKGSAETVDGATKALAEFLKPYRQK